MMGLLCESIGRDCQYFVSWRSPVLGGWYCSACFGSRAEAEQYAHWLRGRSGELSCVGVAVHPVECLSKTQ